jgi:hypothetical protein
LLCIIVEMRFVLFVFVSVLVVSCKKDDLSKGEDNLFFADFSKIGDETRFEDGVNSYGNGPGIRTYEDSIGRLHNEFTRFITNPLDSTHGRNTLSIQMVRFLTDTLLPSYEVSFSFFDEGVYDYGSYTLDSTTGGINGVVIEYVDNDSVLWTTDKKIDWQEGWSNFEITSHNAVEEELFGGKTKGTFNCRVFDGLGSHIDLTNGSFHARTIYQQ